MWLLSHSRFSGTIFLFSLPPFAMAQQKTPPEWRRHKTQNIDMKNCHTGGEVNILAFFNVVASRQISPLFVFGLQIYGLPGIFANFVNYKIVTKSLKLPCLVNFNCFRLL